MGAFKYRWTLLYISCIVTLILVLQIGALVDGAS